ncbi:hypothetical protein BH11PSE7_BH11PSE7_17390 [soil metagenome]
MPWLPAISRAAVGATALLLLAWLVAPQLRALLQDATVSSLDLAVSQALHGSFGPFAVTLMQAVSLLHSTAALLTYAALGGLALWHKGRRGAAALLLISLPGGMLLNFAVKTVVQRARPTWGYAYQFAEGFSFPSGHTAGATLLYGLLAYALWPRLRLQHAQSGRATLLMLVLPCVAIAMVLLVAVSRIVLGVHFFSDCVAGVLEALVWLSICLAGALPLARVLDPPHNGTHTA